MIIDINKKVLIVGLGLLGGSYAEGLKRFGFHIAAITKEESSIAYALEKADIKALDTAIMIGDREYDIHGAKHFGINSIGVLYGYGNYEELSAAGATHIVENVGEILALV